MPAQEQTFSIQVAEARASVGSIKATPELINEPEGFAKFQAAQAQLQSALSRLLLVAENYPPAQVRRGVPRSDRAQLRARKSDYRRTQPFHQGRAGIQRDRAFVPDQSGGDDIQNGRDPNFTVENEKDDQRAADR